MEAGAVKQEPIGIEMEEAAVVSQIINIIIYLIYVCTTIWLCITTTTGRLAASFAVILSSFGGFIVSINNHINGYDTNLSNNICLLNGLFDIYFIMVYGFVAAFTIEYLSSIIALISGFMDTK